MAQLTEAGNRPLGVDRADARHAHFVAPEPPASTTPAPGVDAPTAQHSRPRNTWQEAWFRMRRNPSFWFAVVLTSFILLVAAFPSLFTGKDPQRCVLADSQAPLSAEFPLGADFQGCDILTGLVYGARASVSVGLLAAFATTVLGTLLGLLAGYFRGWVDTVISRVTDVFFAIPLILGAIVAGQIVERRDVFTLTAILMVFGWTGTARIARSATLEVMTKDYVASARTLGASGLRTLLTHVAPNILGPMIVVVTMAIGGLIAAEASLSYLGIGLPPDVPSWGKAISDGRTVLKVNPGILLWPAGALALTVLNFLVLGDVVRSAFGAKEQAR